MSSTKISTMRIQDLKSLFLWTFGVSALFISSCKATLHDDGGCPLLTLIPFSDGSNQGPNQNTAQADQLQRWPTEVIHHLAFSYMAAAQMAVDQFNARDTSVVPELANLQGCPVYFPYQVVIDSAMEEYKAVMGVLAGQIGRKSITRTQRKLQQQKAHRPNMQQGNDSGCPSVGVNSTLPPWCAVIGPMDIKAIQNSEAVTSALGIPQLLYSGAGIVARRADSPSLIGVAESTTGKVRAILTYLVHQKRDYLAVLHSSNPDMSNLATGLDAFGNAVTNITVVTKLQTKLPKTALLNNSQMEAVREGVEFLKGTGIYTILLAFDHPETLKDYAIALEDNGMLGPPGDKNTKDYFFILLQETLSIDSIQHIIGYQEKGSPLDNLLNGAVIITPTDKIVEPGSGPDLFLQSWKAQNSSFVAFLNDLAPTDSLTGQPIYNVGSSYFQDNEPAALASYIFDSVMSVGFGACAMQMEGHETNSSETAASAGNVPAPGTEGQQSQQQSVLLQDIINSEAAASAGNVATPGTEGPQSQQQSVVLQDITNITQNPQNDGHAQQSQTQNGSVHQGQQSVSPQTNSLPPQESTSPQGQGGNGFPQQGNRSPQEQSGGNGQALQQSQQGRQSPSPQIQPNAQLSQPKPQSLPSPSPSEFPSLQPSARLGTKDSQLGELAAYGVPGSRRLSQELTDALGVAPTIEDLFRKIEVAMMALAQANTDADLFVSRVKVTYDNILGCPQRILIVYNDSNSNDTSESKATTSEPRSYNEFTYFAAVSDVRVLSSNGSLNSTTLSDYPDTQLQNAQELLTNAQNLWSSHGVLTYGFKYDLFFDVSLIRVDREKAPFPWDIFVADGKIQAVTDANGNELTRNILSQDRENVSSYSPDPANMTSSLPSGSSADSVASSAPTMANEDVGNVATDGQSSATGTWLKNSTTAAPVVDKSTQTSTTQGINLHGARGAKNLVKYIVRSTFTGASGQVSFGKEVVPKARDSTGTYMGAFNVRPTTVNETTGQRTYSTILSSYCIFDYQLQAEQNWSVVQDFVYRDGTTSAPATGRKITRNNYLSEWVHITGLALFSFAAFLALLCLTLVWVFYDTNTIRAGQPEFLYLLCFGSAMESAAIFTLSWDESYGWSGEQLDLLCTLTPWFFFVGHLLMFSALFTKLWRVDQVLQFSRKKVKVIQVMGPLTLLLLAAVAVLTVWTVLNRFVWERTLIGEAPAETYGECTSDHWEIYFLVLAGLIVFSKIVTAGLAWKTCDIPQDFSDASSVFYAISAHLQAWFIGVPILVVLGNQSADATYFGRVLLIWVFAVSGVGLVVVPKVVKAIRIKINPELEKDEKRGRVRISGLSGPLSTPLSTSNVSHASED